MKNRLGDTSLMKKIFLTLAILTFSISNCASARVVNAKPGEGGTIALTQGILKSA